MTQSVELVLDAAAERAVREQWARLADAGLPTEQRTPPIRGRSPRTPPDTAVRPSPSHRPRVTLYAGDAIGREADARLPGLVAGLCLTMRVGSMLLFGPRRGQLVVVRQVVVSRELLDLQAAVAALCGAEPDGQFAPGRWTPHVTLARRVPVDQVGAVVAALGTLPDLEAPVRGCRRWDSERRETWSL